MKQLIKAYWKSTFIYVFMVLVCCFLFMEKVDYHVDELLTYNLANAEHWFRPEKGIQYIPASKPFVEAMSSDGHFDLEHVWTQQTNDTHPPFYYVLVHAVCVLFPGTLSIRYAGTINIIFMLLVLFMYRRLIKILVDDEHIVFAMSLIFCLSAGVLSIVTFLRMYVMVMFFITAIAYLIVANIDHFGIKQNAALVTITVIGALTHYYYLVYAFFISLVFSVIMLVHKRYKEFMGYVISMAVSGGLSYAIFPAIITHLFGGKRGAQALENIQTSNFGDQFKAYSEILSDSLFGGLLWLVLLVVIFLILADLIISDNKGNESICHISKIELERYLCLLLPSLAFVMVIAKSAPYNVDRYLSPIFAVVIGGLYSLLYTGLKNVLSRKRTRNGIFCLMAFVVIIWGLINCDWSYLKLNSQERLRNSVEYGKNAEAIILYSKPWKINTYYLEISNCYSSTFYKASTYDEFCSRLDGKDLSDNIAFFLVSMDAESFIQNFLQEHEDYTLVCDNGAYSYGHSYYLRKNSSD